MAIVHQFDGLKGNQSESTATRYVYTQERISTCSDLIIGGFNFRGSGSQS